jgi:predicted permease
MAFSNLRIPRILMHHRGFSLCVTISLGVGVSAAAALIAVVDSAKHATLPFANGSRIEQVIYHPRSDPSRRVTVFPVEVARALRSGRPVADVAVYQAQGMRLTDRDRVVELIGIRVSPNFATVLGTKMYLGRAFDRSDTGVPSVILGFDFWTAKLGSDSSIVGRAIEVSGTSAVVTGVATRGSEFPVSVVGARLSDATLSTPDASRRDVEILALLDQPADAAARATIVTRATAAYYETKAWRGAARPEIVIESAPLRDYMLSWLRSVVLILTIIAVFVGLLSAVNFAALVLARGIRRRGELGVRAALGASVKTLTFEIVAESLVLCAMSGVLAALLAPAFVEIVRATVGQFLPAWFHIALSWRSVAWSVLLSLAVGAIFGLGPAVDLARPALTTFLHAASATVSDAGKLGAARSRLVAIQVALATGVLVALGAVLGKTMFLTRADTGFDYANVAIGAVRDSFAAGSIRGSEQLLDGVRAIPGIAAVGLIGYQPVSREQIRVDRGDTPGELPFFVASIDQITPDFFAVMRPRLVAGRLITRDEATRGAPMIVVTRDIAANLFAGRSAIGERLRLPTHPDQPLTIVGVIEQFTLHPYSLGETPTVFLSSSVRGGPTSNTVERSELWLRSSGNPAAVARAVQSRVAHHRFGRVQVLGTTPVAAIVDQDYRTFRALVRFVMGVFAIALGLAALGIYGLVAYTAEMRARELAIREAIGATRVHVSGLVLRGAIIQGTVGVAGGALVATAIIGYLNSFDLRLEAVAGATSLSIVLVAATVLVSSFGPLRSIWKRDLSAVLRV